MAAQEPWQALDGRCTCGAVRYRLNASPLFVHCCHCTWCQRETGTAFAINAMIEAAHVELQAGAVVPRTIPSASGRGQIMSRCGDCGVTLWSNYGGAGTAVHFVRVGTLDEPSRLRPDIHIFTSTKVPWITLPPDVPAVEEFYRRSAYWPAEKIARLNATRGG